jgi:hypothetical protein
MPQLNALCLAQQGSIPNVLMVRNALPTLRVPIERHTSVVRASNKRRPHVNILVRPGRVISALEKCRAMHSRRAQTRVPTSVGLIT